VRKSAGGSQWLTPSRPNIESDPTLSKSHFIQRAKGPWFTPTIYTFGNARRNILRGPGRFNLNTSLFKDFVVAGRNHVQFRGELFNVLNHQFDLPNATIGNPEAVILSATLGTPRDIQLGLRLAF